MNIVQKTAPAKCPRDLKMMYCFGTGFDNLINPILMARTSNSYHMTIDQRDWNDFRFPDIVSALQLYSPDSIHLFFATVDEPYKDLAFVEDDSVASDHQFDPDGPSYDFLPSNKFKSALYQYFRKSQTQWAVFAHFLALLNPLRNQDFCIENMMVLKEKLLTDFVVARVSNVSFKSCILEHSVLQIISQSLPRIDRLVFDTSCILSDKPYSLKIHLPATSINTLKLIIRPLVYALKYFDDDYDYLTCKLETRN